jgi:predicted secreted protein with PEFG-CTERM motif
MTYLSIVFLAVAMISVSALSQNAYAAAGMSLSADGSGDTISISGTSDRSDFDVIIVVSNDMAIKDIRQSSVSGGSFSVSVNVSAYTDGSYTIAASQGDASSYNLSVDVDVSDGSSDSSVSATSSTAADVTIEEVDSSAVAIHGLSLSAGGVEGSTTIDVSGTTDRSDDITITVIAPNGNIVAADQITPSGGSFMTTIETGGALWNQDGMYTISAQQGDASNYKTSADVEIVDGHVIPEFGTIAIMILVVAIVSIIALSAKTKLSIIPKY